MWIFHSSANQTKKLIDKDKKQKNKHRTTTPPPRKKLIFFLRSARWRLLRVYTQASFKLRVGVTSPINMQILTNVWKLTWRELVAIPLFLFFFLSHYRKKLMVDPRFWHTWGIPRNLIRKGSGMVYGGMQITLITLKWCVVLGDCTSRSVPQWWNLALTSCQSQRATLTVSKHPCQPYNGASRVFLLKRTVINDEIVTISVLMNLMVAVFFKPSRHAADKD